MKPVFADTLAALINWVQKDALPVWLVRAQHIPDGWFAAGLAPTGAPLEGQPIQLVTQAQFLYLLARAEHVGWVGGRRRTARDLIDFVGRHGTLPCRSDGYVRSLQAPSVVLDSRCDPVDHAWFVIANTACFAAFGEMSDLRRAYNILDWLHIHFTEGVMWKGVDRKTNAAPELYRYMLRAFLYLAEVTQKPAWRERANALLLLCCELFHLPSIPHSATSKHLRVQFEWREQLAWVRVLCQCQRVLGVGLAAAEAFFVSDSVQQHLASDTSLLAESAISGGDRGSDCCRPGAAGRWCGERRAPGGAIYGQVFPRLRRYW